MVDSSVNYNDLPPGFSPVNNAASATSFSDVPPGFSVAQQPPVDTSFSAGLMHGLQGTGIGLIQTANDLTGQRLLSPEWKAAADRAAANVGQAEKGTGIIGTTGEIVGNPLNWAPWKSLLAYGATVGATAPQSNDTGVGGRLLQGAITAPITAATGFAAGKLGQAAQWGLNKTGIPDLINSALAKFGASGDGTDMYNLAKEAGLNVEGKSPQEIANSLQEWYQGQTQDLAGKVSQRPFNPEETFKGIASNWKGEQQAANEAYQGAKTLGANITQPIPELPQKLDTIIGSLEGNTLPGTSEHAALQQLKNIRATLPDNIGQSYGFGGETIAGTPAEVPASTLMDLRANLNEAYNPKLLPERGDIAPASVLSDVRGALTKAAAENPEFGNQLQYADARQANLGYLYKNNALLQKFFKPEDLTALQQNAASGTPIPDITLKRSNALISAIKTPEDMATLTKAMPPEMADSLRAAKLQDLMKNAGLNYDNLVNPKFVSLMKESLKDDPEAVKQVGVIQEIANALKKRDINVESPEAIRKESGESGHLLRAAWDLFEGRKSYAIRMAYRALTEEDKAGLLGLQQEINQGAPFKNVIPNAAKQAAARLSGNITTAPQPQPATAPLSDQNMQELQKAQQSLPPQSNAQPAPKPTASTQANNFFAKESKAESGNNPNAKSKTSSASGLFGFTNRTWADMVRRYGKQTGFNLGDKNNPQAQATMARLLAQDNIKSLQTSLGRMPTKPEVYYAHVFGAEGADKLIKAAPDKQAIMLFPRNVIDANHSLFFENGKPRTVGEVEQILARKIA